MAWMAGKTIVLYKADSRSLIQGSDNPLVLGLGNFAKVSTIPEIAYAFTQLCRNRRPAKPPAFPQAARRVVEPGRRLAKLLAACKSPADIVPVIVSVTRRPSRVSAR